LVKKTSGIQLINIYYQNNKILNFNKIIGSYSKGIRKSGSLVEKIEKKRRFAVDAESGLPIVDLDLFLAIVRFLKKEDKKNQKEFYTPIHIAANHDNMWVTKTLLRKGVSVKADSWKSYPELSYFKDTLQVKWFSYPLHKAVKSNNFKLVKLFYEKGAQVNILDKDGHTPLYITKMFEGNDKEEKENKKIIEFLKSKGANLGKNNKLTETVYQF